MDRHLCNKKILCKSLEMEKVTPDPNAPDKALKVGLFSVVSFILADCTVLPESIDQDAGFLAKVPRIQKAISREDQPRPYFFAMRVSAKVDKMDVIARLDEANCHWYVGGKYSSDL